MSGPLGGFKSRLRRIGRLLLGRPPSAVRPPPEHASASPASHVELVERLRWVVVQHSDGTLAPEDVGAGDHLYERRHVDSVSSLALLTFIEDHYGVTIDEADLLARLCSLDALARHILASAAQPKH
jgi:acyl carrier protein